MLAISRPILVPVALVRDTWAVPFSDMVTIPLARAVFRMTFIFAAAILPTREPALAMKARREESWG